MCVSMTGYGQASLADSPLLYEAWVRSVNGRFLEVRLHLPRELQVMESKLRAQVTTVFRRGNIDLSIKVNFANERKWRVEARENLIEAYLKAYRSVSRKLKVKGDIPSDFLFRVPDFFEVKSEDTLGHLNEDLVLEVARKAMMQCQTERQREGQSLKKELHRLIKALEQQTQGLVEHAESQAKAERLRVRQILNEPQVSAESIFERGDVTEELVRFREHLRSLRALLKGNDTVGKRLDFYCQELGREINTVGSKSLSAKLTEGVVEAKMLIEKVKEQVQNLE